MILPIRTSQKISIVSCNPLIDADLNDILVALNEFMFVPQDYLYILVKYGYLEFLVGEGDDIVSFTFRGPLHASEFHSKVTRGFNKVPKLYPFAASFGSSSLYYGDLNGKVGVFYCPDSAVAPENMKFISKSLLSLLQEGEGVEKIIELEL